MIDSTPATAARRVPPDPGRWACCGGTRQHGHDADCITVLGYWRWLLFGWRHKS